MSHGWNGQLARIWTKMVGPSRPTISELSIFDKYAKALQSKNKHRLKLLVMGSTPEFRDWGYENNFEISVMDCNPDYHDEIFREIRHKCIEEKYLCSRWQDLMAENEYDIIIGDLVIGNIAPDELDDFIFRVSKALSPCGLFLGKSFYRRKNYIPPTPEELIRQYYEGSPWHPYSALSYDLTINCLDENNMLSFPKQYAVLQRLNERGILSDETFSYFQGVGWDNDMKFLFHVPILEEYEKLLEKYLHIYKIEYGNEVYSPNFPLHIVGKKDNKILSEILKEEII